nr:MAG TPA: hypothetical protein [Caudoviricetes sp.]
MHNPRRCFISFFSVFCFFLHYFLLVHNLRNSKP